MLPPSMLVVIIEHKIGCDFQKSNNDNNIGLYQVSRKFLLVISIISFQRDVKLLWCGGKIHTTMLRDYSWL